MTAGLILAAGAGSRYGRTSKLLADLGGRPLLEHAIEAQCSVAELGRVVVVLGAHSAAVLGSVDFMRSEPVVCERWSEGLSASLRRGGEALAGSGRVIVTLGDEPLMTPQVIARFLDAPPGTRATYNGRPGHPVVFGPEHLRAVRELRGDAGARDLFRGGATIECSDLGGGGDIDTAADLEAIRSRVAGTG